jgi:hypothetical protein
VLLSACLSLSRNIIGFAELFGKGIGKSRES